MKILMNLRLAANKKLELCSVNEKQKYILINEILKNDDCFFKISISTAYAILKDLDISDDEIDIVYRNLISQESFKENNKLYKINP